MDVQIRREKQEITGRFDRPIPPCQEGSALKRKNLAALLLCFIIIAGTGTSPGSARAEGLEDPPLSSEEAEQLPASDVPPVESPSSAPVSEAEDGTTEDGPAAEPVPLAESQVGAFTVSGSPDNYSYSGGVLTVSGGTISVRNTDPAAATSDRIFVRGVSSLTLCGVNIVSGVGAPLEVSDDASTEVTLTLENDNFLTSNCGGKAGLHKCRGQSGGSNTARLVIQGGGSLTAVGGRDASGIGGGGNHADVTNITVLGGVITARGSGYRSAGIGSAGGGSVWNLSLAGGYINATGTPGIGADNDYGGLSGAEISGGFVRANSYAGSTPTGGIVLLDNDKNIIVAGDQTLSEALTVPEGGKLTVLPGGSLSIAEGLALTVNGTLVNHGTVAGAVINNGSIYNNGSLPNVGGRVYNKPCVVVKGGSYSGTVAAGNTVTVTADEPAPGMLFSRWRVNVGDNVKLSAVFAPSSDFTMIDGCVELEAVFVNAEASITAPDGSVRYYQYADQASSAWTEPGSKLTLLSDVRYMYLPHTPPQNGVLDLNGKTVTVETFPHSSNITVQNGELSLYAIGGMTISEDSTLAFKDVRLSYRSSRDLVIQNNGIVLDLGGLTLADNVSFAGQGLFCSLTDGLNRRWVYGSGSGLSYTITGTWDGLERVSLDDEALDTGAYALEGDQLTVNLSANRLSALEAGTHRLLLSVGSRELSLSFTVVPAENQWTEPLSIESWTYGESARAPHAAASFGSVSYLYSDRADGEYTAAAPAEAGTWYVKALVAATPNFSGLESAPLSFAVAPRAADSISLPTIGSDTKLDSLEIKLDGVALVPGRDYDVVRTQIGNELKISIVFKGNYTGTVARTVRLPSAGAAPDTGDSQSAVFWGAVMLISALSLTAFSVRLRRRS